jgi:hypothetical protein
LKVQLARLPTRQELTRAALGVIFCSAVLVISMVRGMAAD